MGSAAPNERWELRSNDSTIRVESKPEMCMDADGGRLESGDSLILYPCSATSNEQWVLSSSDSTIRVKSKPEMCMSTHNNEIPCSFQPRDCLQGCFCAAAQGPLPGWCGISPRPL